MSVWVHYLLVRIPLSTVCPSRRGGRALLLLVYRNKSHHVIRTYYRDVIIIIINALIAVRVDWDAAVDRSVEKMEMVAPSCLRPTSISGIRSALFRHDLGREISNQYANQKLYYFLSINKTFTSNRNTHRQPVSQPRTHPRIPGTVAAAAATTERDTTYLYMYLHNG